MYKEEWNGEDEAEYMTAQNVSRMTNQSWLIMLYLSYREHPSISLLQLGQTETTAANL